MTDAPSISVVIPSVMRDSLPAAVQSAMEQTHKPVEVIVVFDLTEVPLDFQPPADGIRTIATGGRRGAAYARQLGVEASVGDAIAFLDDDDIWLPGKLEAQACLLATARAAGLRAVVGAGGQATNGNGRIIAYVPRRQIADGQTITDYLFRRCEIVPGEAALGSSMLLADRELLTTVPFDSTLTLHEDWDWLVRVSRQPRVCFRMAPGVHVSYRMSPPGASLSSSVHWSRSLAWAERTSVALTPREYGDFLLSVTLPLAIDTDSRAAALRVAARAVRRGRPGPAALAAATVTVFFSRRLQGLAVRAWEAVRSILQARRQPCPS